MSTVTRVNESEFTCIYYGWLMCNGQKVEKLSVRRELYAKLPKFRVAQHRKSTRNI